MKTKILIGLIILVVLGAAGGVYWYKEIKTKWVAIPTSTPSTEKYFPGWAPGTLGLAISSDGKTAYIPFNLDDALLVVDLSTFTVKDSIDVSAAGSMLFSNAAVLTPDGKKLYVANEGAGNVMVVNTETRRVEKVLPIKPLHAAVPAVSRDGSKVYMPGENGLYIVNTSDNSYQYVFVPNVIFGPVVPSPSNPNLLYVAGKLINIGSNVLQPTFFTFNISNNTVVRSSKLVNDVLPPDTFARRLVINSNETFAYFGWMQMAGQSGERGIGNLIVFDLNTFQVSTSAPIENGVADFAVSKKTDKIYIAGFWAGGSAPQKLTIQEWDILTSKIIRQIPVSPSTDQRAIALDTVDANYLYMTEGDYNFIRKVEISTGKEIGKLQFNKSEIKPYAIIRGDNNIGYIVSQSYGGDRPIRKVYKFDLAFGQLIASMQLPFSYSAYGFYQGKLYFGGEGNIYTVKAETGKIIKKYRVGGNLNPKTFVFFGDKMVTIDYGEAMNGRRLIFFDAKNMSVLKSVELPREPHGDKVIVSPDGSKLYVSRGSTQGNAAITIFNASNLEIINTIEIPFVGITRRGMTGFVEADFDETKRILYLTGFTSVYKINMDTDKLIGIIDLIDLYEPQNIRGWSPTGLSGVTLSPAKDKLFIISGDAHSMYTYDLARSAWITKTTNLKGYFITDAIASLDRRYLYTVNQESDSITMVDLTSGDVVKIIDL
ncbi:MAG: hypothetical protein WC610_03415 [Patescibacteria group bacterium]